MCVCVCVCVCVRACVRVWWLCGVVVVSLGQGLRSLSSSPSLAIFTSNFSICLLPVHPAMIGDLAFAGVQIQGLFSCNSNDPGGTSGTHTTFCEEISVLLRVLSPALGALLAWLTVPA